MNSYADSPVLSQIKPQEFYIGTWTTSARNGLGALKSDFPSRVIYKIRLNLDGTLLPLNHIQVDNPYWLVKVGLV